MKKTLALLLLFSIYCQGSAKAELFHDRFLNWSVFSTQMAGKEICYSISLPIKNEGNYNKRGQPYILITNIGGNIQEISVASGYNYKENSEVELSFGLKKFSIFTYKNLAWSNSKSDDIEILKAMRVYDDVIISATTKDNRYSKDTYSLLGFLKAYKKMLELCP